MGCVCVCVCVLRRSHNVANSPNSDSWVLELIIYMSHHIELHGLTSTIRSCFPYTLKHWGKVLFLPDSLLGLIWPSQSFAGFPQAPLSCTQMLHRARTTPMVFPWLLCLLHLGYFTSSRRTVSASKGDIVNIHFPVKFPTYCARLVLC